MTEQRQEPDEKFPSFDDKESTEVEANLPEDSFSEKDANWEEEH